MRSSTVANSGLNGFHAVAGLLVAFLLAACGGGGGPDDTGDSVWVGTWAAAHASLGTPVRLEDQTVRQIARVSIGGDRVRIRVSNALGAVAVEIASASVALRASESAIVEDTHRALTFRGESSVALDPGEDALSESVDIDIRPGDDLAVSFYFAQSTELSSLHPFAHQTGYLSSAGDHASSVDFPISETRAVWYVLTAIETRTSTDVGAVVTLGDSITDGAGSTLDANARWPDRLAVRLGGAMGVLNAGLGGNQVLSSGIPLFGPSALSRFDRDVLAHAGVTHLIVLEGINDIQLGNATAPEVISGLEEIVARARAAGLSVLGGTLTPFEGWATFTADREADRQEVNRWIRESGTFDAVVDFDGAVRDPDSPARLLPAYDSGDHLHPSDAGYRAMGDAVDVSFLVEDPG